MVETMEGKVVKLPENRCEFCGRIEATRLCDKVKGVFTAIDLEGSGVITNTINTCDKKLCDKCATYIDGADYCPDCIKILKKALR